ncbi:MAG: alanine dehydrogenase [Halobacteriovoraceae bacterium]|nr:alanine dehydrogenase [Halobacteriovoraceae bacterium]MCB9095585.1 alanine dehydrogenase [Halobacteriovoraceae bacterium]
MKIGIPKEIKNNENRAGLVPGGVRQLVEDGHTVYFQSGLGKGIGLTDYEYTKAGGIALPTLEEVYEQSQLIVKVKEPQPNEIKLLNKNHIIYTYLHLAADKELTMGLMESGCTGVAYETIQEKDGSLPLLTPMSEVAGRMAAQVGASYLQANNGGKGILMGGVPGVPRAKVTVIGCGIAGTNALKMAMGMGADVIAIDLSTKRLAEMDDLFENRITTLFSNAHNIEEAVIQSDLVIGAVLVPGAKAPKLVTREHIRQMAKGSVVVDIAVDQGGCIETCKPTTHENPVYDVDGVIHYSVANMPGAVPKTSTFALTNVTLKYARFIANYGLKGAIEKDPILKSGVNVHAGKLVYEQVAKDHDLPYTPLEL